MGGQDGEGGGGLAKVEGVLRVARSGKMRHLCAVRLWRGAVPTFVLLAVANVPFSACFSSAPLAVRVGRLLCANLGAPTLAPTLVRMRGSAAVALTEAVPRSRSALQPFNLVDAAFGVLLHAAMIVVLLFCAPARALAWGGSAAESRFSTPTEVPDCGPSRLQNVAGTRWFEELPLSTQGYKEYKAGHKPASAAPRPAVADEASATAQTATVCQLLAGADGFATSEKVKDRSDTRQGLKTGVQALAIVTTGTLGAHMYRTYYARRSS